MSEETLLFDRILPFCFSIFSGLYVHYFDGVLSNDTKWYLTVVLSAFERTGQLLVWRLSGVFPSLSSSLFRVLAIWHLFLVFRPITRHILREESDDRFFKSMANVEWRISFYFGPTIVRLLFMWLWPVKYIASSVLLIVAGAWYFSPKYPSLLFWKSVVFIGGGFNKYDFTFRGLFMRGCDVLTGYFDRWEISVARRRREAKTIKPPSHKYEKLKGRRHIRLLRLRRRRPFSEPTYELIDVPLADAPPFEALSYTWGKIPPSIPLVVDGQCILVTSAVEEVLFYERSIFRAKYFWIDSICINQGDNIEKNAQLILMADVYKRASRVLIWLAPPENFLDTHVTRKLIRFFSWPVVFSLSRNDLLSSLFENEAGAFIAVAKLFCHHWFERVWILQEAAFGRTVHVWYHGMCIELDTICNTASEINGDREINRRLQYYLASKSDSLESSKSSTSDPSSEDLVSKSNSSLLANAILLQRIRNQVQDDKRPSLALIILWTNKFRATDPRDKIFGILGLARDGDQLPFKPDYNEPIDEVYIKATTFMLCSEDWFLLIAFTGRGYQTLPRQAEFHPVVNLPSWVPDYSFPVAPAFRIIQDENVGRSEEAGMVIMTNNPRVIILEAIAFDRVRYLGPKIAISTSPTIPTFASSGDALPTQVAEFLANSQTNLREWYLKSRALAREIAQKSVEEIDQAFWELCLSERGTAIPDSPSYPISSSASRKLFEQAVLADAKDRVVEWETALLLGKEKLVERWKVQAQLIEQFSITTMGKTFCVTTSGKMALVPPNSKVGDVMVHVRGGFLPLIFRETGSRIREAELVGCCSVWGVRDAQSGLNWEHWSLI